MDSTPRRWVLRPLSPSLQPSDLRSISSSRDHDVFLTDNISIVGAQSAVYVDGHSESSADVVVMARQVSVSKERVSSRSSSSSEDLPISPCSSSSGASHSGFYSFVEDPLSPEAERNEAWMVSPQRQTQLATLREANGHKLQSYSGYRQPGSLFQDDSMDSQYRIDKKYGYEVVGEQEERQLRKEIIRNQAPKKGTLVETDGAQPFDDDTNRLIEGLSISYSQVNTKPSVVVASEAINEEQINFNAARKQFLQMEQNKLDPIIRPRKVQVKTSIKENVETRRDVQVPTAKVEDIAKTETKDNRGDSSRQSSVFEESEDMSLNLGTSFSSDDGPLSEVLPENGATEFNAEYETPIEREIRIAQEREKNLRRSRGLQQSVSGEMVEIKTKRLPLTPVTPVTPLRAKERSRVSFIFQEIQQKEEATKQDGSRPDVRGPRRGSFDVLEARSTEGNQENTTTWVPESSRESVGTKFDVVDYALQKQNTQLGSYQESWQSSHQNLQDYVDPYLRNHVESRIYTNDQERPKKGEEESYKSPDERWQSPNQNGVESIVERSMIEPISDDVFPMPCCPHRHPEGSEGGYKQDAPSQTPSSWRSSLEKTGLQTRGQGSVDFIERDIEETLRREQELKEQREARAKQVYSPQTLVQQADKMAAAQFYPQTRTDKMQFRSLSSPRPVQRLSGLPLMSPQPWSPAPSQTHQTWSPAPSQTSQTHQPWSPVSPQTPQSPGVVPTSLPVRGLTQTLLQDFEERRVKLKLEESAYAGIQPVDSVNNEVVESTRVTRHKNQRALQWEAGLFLNQQDS